MSQLNDPAPATPVWELGLSANTADPQAIRAGLQAALATLQERSEGRDRDLVAALRVTLELGDLGLPPFPDTVLELRRQLDEDRVDSVGISKLVRADPGLAKAVWQASSSAASGGKRPATLQQGIVRLGHQRLWKIAMFVALDDALFKVHGYETQVLSLRIHGAEVADLAEWLAPDHQRGAAWMAGLLHDSGKLVLCRLASLLHIPPSSPMLRTLMNQYHAPIGALVAYSWELRQVGEAIAFHHGKGHGLADLVRWADIAAHGADLARQGHGPAQTIQALGTLDHCDPEELLAKAICSLELAQAA